VFLPWHKRPLKTVTGITHFHFFSKENRISLIYFYYSTNTNLTNKQYPIANNQITKANTQTAEIACRVDGQARCDLPHVKKILNGEIPRK
jgi:hypothetical protein